ncbi:helix-turn-helix domain-containing protein [Turicibacter sanguinis]|nr:helix-turn-helix domain-containing protein [Turicibacter sanguinis]
MSYHHLNLCEHTLIEIVSKLGYSTRQMAQELKHHHSTITPELKRK